MFDLILKFIYSKKAIKFLKIFTLLLSYVVPVKSKSKISHNFVAFSEYMNFIRVDAGDILPLSCCSFIFVGFYGFQKVIITCQVFNCSPHKQFLKSKMFMFSFLFPIFTCSYLCSRRANENLAYS